MTLIRTLYLAALCGRHFTATAQITVTSTTFPQVGDTLHAVLAANPVPIGFFRGPPGGNQHWDCSQLGAGQRISITFRPASAGTLAQVCFP